MTALVISWRPATTPAASLPLARDVLTLLQVSPIRVSSGTTSVVVVPGESFDLPAGEPVSMTIELPRLKTVHAHDTVPEEVGPAPLALDTDGLLGELADRLVLTGESRSLRPRTSRGDLPLGRREIRSMAVNIGKGLRSLAPAAAARIPRHAALAGGNSGVAVSGPLPVSLAAKVVSRWTLPRYMMIPYAGSATNECRIIPVTPVGASTRLRVEPTDPVAILLMDYLLAGKFVLACAAARAVERHRADGNPSEWARPSYGQLLIGYSYALGHDAGRLERWCRRTDAARSLGTDGLILAAEAARLRLDRAGSISAIEQAAGAPPPLLLHGADLGLRITSVLLAEIGQQPGASSRIPPTSQVARLREVRSAFMRLLFVADAESSPLSIPTARSPAATSPAARLRSTTGRTLSWLTGGWRQRYSVVSERRTQIRRYLVGAAMPDPIVISQIAPAEPSPAVGQSATSGDRSSSSPKLSGAALWMAIFAIVVWIGFSAVLIFEAGRNETEWTRIAWVFGSIQAVAFTAAGALFGTAVQQQNVSNARQQATSAKQDADQQRDDATKGRALATTIQAEAAAPSADGAPQPMGAADTGIAEPAAQRHAQLSRALFGDLV